MATMGVSLLERGREYSRAAVLLRGLLASGVCPGRRGYWWTRLSTDLEHVGRVKEAMEVAGA